MNAATLLVSCPKCRLKFRIVISSGAVHVTCPRCRAQWDWRPPASSDGAVGQMRNFWQSAFLRPRLSFAASAAVLLAGLGLGLYWGHYQWAPTSLQSPPPPIASTNVPPLTRPAKPAATNRPSSALESRPIESLLPSNDLNFEPQPLDSNLSLPKTVP